MVFEESVKLQVARKRKSKQAAPHVGKWGRLEA